MLLPRHATLFHVPSGIEIDASIVALTGPLIRREMGSAWWDDPALNSSLSAREIDRHWNWVELEIERGGRLLAAQRLAVVTSDGAVQGAMLLSTEPVPCERR